MRNRCFPGSVIVFLLIFFLSSCNGAVTGGASVWIDVPLDGMKVPEGQQVKIEGHTASSGGIDRVEVWVDGSLLTTVADPPMEGTLGKFQTSWTPSVAGEHTIQVIAYGADGAASQPDSARIFIGTTSIIGTPIITEPPLIVVTPLIATTVVATETFTPTPPVEVIQFWADPPQIQAGTCSLIQWHVENVQKVVFGGSEQSFDGSYKDCPCSDQRYTLTVTRRDGSEEKQRVDLAVTGSCATPTLVDSTPPPAPTLVVPADGLTISCKSSQTLTWLPVSDPSGILKYELVVQRHSGDNNWQTAPSGQQVLTDKTTSVPVECGWYYRWRVRALDGAGNVGPWSGWSQFIITLG